MDMKTPLEKVIARSGQPTIVETLAETLSTSQLTTLLLEVFRRKTAKLSPRQVLQAWRHNRFVRPPGGDALADRRFELAPPPRRRQTATGRDRRYGSRTAHDSAPARPISTDSRLTPVSMACKRTRSTTSRCNRAPLAVAGIKSPTLIPIGEQ